MNSLLVFLGLFIFFAIASKSDHAPGSLDKPEIEWCKNFRMSPEERPTLWADCRNRLGTYVATGLNLNLCLWNDHGYLTWAEGYAKPFNTTPPPYAN